MASLKNVKFPTAHTVLFIIAAFVALLTWIIPAGQYDRLSYDPDNDTLVQSNETKQLELPATQSTLDELDIKIGIEKFKQGAISKPISIPGTYQKLEGNPQGFVGFIKAPLRGIMDSAEIILLVLIIGGLISIINESKAFEAGIAWLSDKLKGKEFILIILVTSLIALGGTTFGLEEETIAFYPILIPIFLAAKYDALVCVGSIYIGSSIGTLASTINPFSTMIASDAAGINWTEGLTGRLIMLGLGLTLCIIYIIRYAQKIQKDATKSIIYDQYEEIRSLFPMADSSTMAKLDFKLKLVLVVFALAFVIMVYGVSRLGWQFIEMTAVFLTAALLIGVLTRMNEKKFVDAFMNGAKDLLSVAFIIGIARGVTVLMEDGQVSDTLLFYASELTAAMPKGLFINVAYLLYTGLTFFIPSSSGMAVLTMPIMAPLSDGFGIGREIMVSAYQYGVGLFKIINPTGILLASLAIVNVGYNKWLKFVMPLVLLLAILSMTILTIGVYF
ncbi:YfcC family protein [Muricauda sp. 2012CJ35-5]|uniref:YfcC family protein n=1 Tax=Flagellimonas spongiicola TaxID=2942208 RepID=A0ABT0PQR0_9FLAO|nr:YfcC family protein [Allomuricauda spongiicola]MCL6273311.1 YfcC family protein [Allomuricauda spongiicola]